MFSSYVSKKHFSPFCSHICLPFLSYTACFSHTITVTSFVSSFISPLVFLFSPYILISCCLLVYSVSFQPTASGFTWLSLAGYYYCSRGWHVTGIYTLLGPWMVNVNAQTLSALCWWHFVEVLCLWTYACLRGKDCLFPDTKEKHIREQNQSDLGKLEQEMIYIPLKVMNLQRKL